MSASARMGATTVMLTGIALTGAAAVAGPAAVQYRTVALEHSPPYSGPTVGHIGPERS